jgi:hypothetical protein
MNQKSLPSTKMDANKKPSSRPAPAMKSTILLFLIFFPLSFLHLIVHEGGHALVNLIHNVPHTIIYVYPYLFYRIFPTGSRLERPLTSRFRTNSGSLTAPSHFRTFVETPICRQSVFSNTLPLECVLGGA